jgi:hypothetical protein
MPALTWAIHHRLLALGMGVTILVAAIAAGVWFFVLRSPATQVDLSQALRLYRQGQHPGVAGSDSQLPPPGVYQHRTSGGEQLSFGDINRTFPAATDMIVTDTGCSTMKWEPFEQHVEGLVECPLRDGALSITSAPRTKRSLGSRPLASSTAPPAPIWSRLTRPTANVGIQHATRQGRALSSPVRSSVRHRWRWADVVCRRSTLV